MRILVAGVGNVLRGDDGFGVAVAERLLKGMVPPEVAVVEVGIGGIHLVQELIAEPFDCLLVVDAVDLGRSPGTVAVIRPEVEDARTFTPRERHDRLADIHYAEPGRAMMLARSIGVLPPSVLVVGCQPLDAEEPMYGLSAAVEHAVAIAVEQVRGIVLEMGVSWETLTDASG